MVFFLNLRFSRLTVVLYYPYGSRLLISSKEVKYEGLGRPQRFHAFKAPPRSRRQKVALITGWSPHDTRDDFPVTI